MFEALERINDDDLDEEGLDKEIKRAEATTKVATTIINNAKRKEVSYMAAVENNRPDPMKAFKAIAMILNAREEGVKVRLTSVRKVEEDVRKAG